MPEFGQTLVAACGGPPCKWDNEAVFAMVLRETRRFGQEVLVLIWDNASWHTSCEVRRWIGRHNRAFKKGEKAGVRIVSCFLSKQSPWLNAIEPKWVHGKRKVVEPDGLLGAHELAERVCAAFGCPHYEHLSITV